MDRKRLKIMKYRIKNKVFAINILGVEYKIRNKYNIICNLFASQNEIKIFIILSNIII